MQFSIFYHLAISFNNKIFWLLVLVYLLMGHPIWSSWADYWIFTKSDIFHWISICITNKQMVLSNKSDSDSDSFFWAALSSETFFNINYTLTIRHWPRKKAPETREEEEEVGMTPVRWVVVVAAAVVVADRSPRRRSWRRNPTRISKPWSWSRPSARTATSLPTNAFISAPCSGTKWARIIKNTDCITGPLARPFTHLPTLLTHSLASPCLLNSATLTYSLTSLSPMVLAFFV